MPEYLKKRFQSKSIRTVITVVALISCVFTKTSVSWRFSSLGDMYGMRVGGRGGLLYS